MTRHMHLAIYRLKGCFSGWALAAAMGVAAVQGIAQQDEGPILRPKPKPMPGAAPTLLVTCDLACNWKLDGEAQGRIAARGSSKSKVETGEHVVAAATEEGLDKIQQLTEVKGGGQTVVSLELQPVRDARLKAEQEVADTAGREKAARERTQQEAADKAARERAQQEAADKAAGEKAQKDADTRLTSTDPATGLMWAKKDNGSDVTWQQATDYCRNLELAGHSDWRLPTIEELPGIYDPNANAVGLYLGDSSTWHAKGNLQLSGWEWSSSPGKASGQAWQFSFHDGRRWSLLLGDSYSFTRAICVRRSGE